GHTPALSCLLDRGASPGARDADGWTPLHLAALGGHADATRALLAAGAAPDALSDLPQSRPRIVAAELGHVEVARLLLDGGAAIDGGTAHKPAPLEAALRFRQLDTARMLLRAGARVEAQSAAEAARLLAGDATDAEGAPTAGAGAAP